MGGQLRQYAHLLIVMLVITAANSSYFRPVTIFRGLLQEKYVIDAFYQLDPEKALTASLLFSNRAQTAIKERDFAAALQDATQALKYNASNEKAILRKLVALENLERFESALQLANDVLDNGDRTVAAFEVKQMGRMVHDKQQLRVNFGCLLQRGCRSLASEEDG
ncbi:hypothetical protein F441_05273 [Phytophthora nicotianae CJ01A1]|uniref:Uncharacterized protein n=3 Tax=Phytophthora nicotianae TaxID=4792 RepID=V9FLP5_PHYNI|nr:hypothetical protein F443_05268 [Phytophthora nicotianae P1569]ETL44637.1 hypothetical protein L916_05089 [Phytophthora nicotianae]ETP21123.1 hypothetical protein F441_05273 [Phytophthora nicotianae CJ01A1]